jgi:hypothetical protein
MKQTQRGGSDIIAFHFSSWLSERRSHRNLTAMRHIPFYIALSCRANLIFANMMDHSDTEILFAPTVSAQQRFILNCCIWLLKHADSNMKMQKKYKHSFGNETFAINILSMRCPMCKTILKPILYHKNRSNTHRNKFLTTNCVLYSTNKNKTNLILLFH